MRPPSSKRPIGKRDSNSKEEPGPPAHTRPPPLPTTTPQLHSWVLAALSREAAAGGYLLKCGRGMCFGKRSMGPSGETFTREFSGSKKHSPRNSIERIFWPFRITAVSIVFSIGSLWGMGLAIFYTTNPPLMGRGMELPSPHRY